MHNGVYIPRESVQLQSSFVESRDEEVIKYLHNYTHNLLL